MQLRIWHYIKYKFRCWCSEGEMLPRTQRTVTLRSGGRRRTRWWRRRRTRCSLASFLLLLFLISRHFRDRLKKKARRLSVTSVPLRLQNFSSATFFFVAQDSRLLTTWQLRAPSCHLCAWSCPLHAPPSAQAPPPSRQARAWEAQRNFHSWI